VFLEYNAINAEGKKRERQNPGWKERTLEAKVAHEKNREKKSCKLRS